LAETEVGFSFFSPYSGKLVIFAAGEEHRWPDVKAPFQNLKFFIAVKAFFVITRGGDSACSGDKTFYYFTPDVPATQVN